jgi:uncharacterized protein (TIGR02145 family)
MKNNFRTMMKLSSSAFLLAAIFINGCKKNDDNINDDKYYPKVYTSAATYIGTKWAVLNGNVNAKGLTTLVTFEYGTTTEYQYSLNADPDTLTESVAKYVLAILTDLTPGTEYHFRIKAVNSVDSAYGGDLTFTTSSLSNNFLVFNPTLTYDSVTDFEGNEYKTIQIGSQTWMAENLRSIKYNDGEEIPFLFSNSSWEDATAPGYCWYNNDSSAYGALYNRYAINTNKLCPAGWHVPDDDDWAALIDNVGGEPSGGKNLKETGTTHWSIMNSVATNESGFTALPAGYRNYSGAFKEISVKAYWWSAAENGNYVSLSYSYSNVDRSSTAYMTSGFSVRCVKDN